MKSLTEDQTLKTLFKYLAPWWFLGFLGLFSPLIYSLLPVHGADICLCVFFQIQANSSWRALPALTTTDYSAFLVINILSVYVVNYTLIFIFVLAVYKIRHVKDNTLIRNECAVIVFYWCSIILPEFIILTLLFA